MNGTEKRCADDLNQDVNRFAVRLFYQNDTMLVAIVFFGFLVCSDSECALCTMYNVCYVY